MVLRHAPRRNSGVVARFGAAALLLVCLAANPALAVEFGPRLRARAAAAAAPGLAPAPPLRLIAVGPDAEQFAARLAGRGLSARRWGSVVRVDVPMPALAVLGGDERVTVDLGARLRPLLDVSAEQSGVDAALRAERGGRDVIVAILDTGVDFAHPDFRNDDGSTRFVAYWDQTIEGDDAEAYGLVCDALDIDRGDCPNDADEPVAGFLPNGHGSHVAGIAAGGDARFRGVAPEALLVGVRLDFEESGLIDALDWVDRLASDLGKPAVINLSLGANEGPHDGDAPSERMIDEMSGPGRVVVAAAGNEGAGNAAGRIHAAMPPSDDEMRARLRTTGVASPESFHLQLWADAAVRLEVAVAVEVERDEGIGAVLDESRFLAPADLDDEGNRVTLRADGSVAATVLAERLDYGGAARGLQLTFERGDRPLDAYAWQIVVRGRSGDAHAWLTDRVATFEAYAGPVTLDLADGGTRQTWLVAGDADRTITLPGAARRAITVSGYVTRNRWTALDGEHYSGNAELGTLLDIASHGPTRDGRLKPEITAPGEYIGSTLATTLEFVSGALQLDMHHGLQRGTSMATPHVAGVAALLLEGNPDLDPEDVKELLATLAVSSTATGVVPNPAWGHGILALDGVGDEPAWRAVAGLDDVPPQILAASVETRDGDTVVAWQTDELADGEVIFADGGTVTRRSFGLRHELRRDGQGGGAVRIRARDPRGNMAESEELAVAQGCGCSAAGGGGPPWPGMLLAVVAWVGLRHTDRSDKGFPGGRRSRSRRA